MLKAIQDLVDLLNNAFQEGECACVRCRSGEDQEWYRTPHNFEINGKIHRRRFAASGKEDLGAKIKKALKAKRKQDYSLREPIEEGLIRGIISEEECRILLLLGESNGLISHRENGIIYFNKF